MKTIDGAAHLNGQKTAENYIDECVLRVGEPGVLFALVQKITNEDELRGFCGHIERWMVSK